MASLIKKNGAFYVVYSIVDQDGKKKQKWETFHSEADAKKRKTEIEYKLGIGKLTVPHCKTLDELLDEYVALYGKTKWSLSMYSSNTGLINHYISPLIGEMNLREITPRILERYYQTLQTTPAVRRATDAKYDDIGNRYVEKATIVKIHKLLNSAFTQALKWDLVEKNPATFAEVPKYEAKKREIWDMNTLQKANEVCKDSRLKLCINLAFACSLRIGELLGLTWDCVDITEESIKNGTAYIFINKELQRVNKDAFTELGPKDVIVTFPELLTDNKTIRILKTPKTPTSNRKIFLPKTVALMLVDWKKGQDEIKEALGSEYTDFNLVIANCKGGPTEATRLQERFKRFIKQNDLPEVVFHSLRHSSITYKLKLTGGDIKAVQGDSGHAQAKMVTDQYSHILDDNRKENARLLEEAFYGKREPGSFRTEDKNMEEESYHFSSDSQNSDIAKLVSELSKNPEMLQLLLTLSKKL